MRKSIFSAISVGLTVSAALAFALSAGLAFIGPGY
jgi:hypothetical protein